LSQHGQESDKGSVGALVSDTLSPWGRLALSISQWTLLRLAIPQWILIMFWVSSNLELLTLNIEFFLLCFFHPAANRMFFMGPDETVVK